MNRINVSFANDRTLRAMLYKGRLYRSAEATKPIKGAKDYKYYRQDGKLWANEHEVPSEVRNIAKNIGE